MGTRISAEKFVIISRMAASLNLVCSAGVEPTTLGFIGLFRKMLESCHPPDDWKQWLAEARAEELRLQQFATAITP